jgi:hypothetical protein
MLRAGFAPTFAEASAFAKATADKSEGKQDKFRAYSWFLQKILIYGNISCFQGLHVYIIILAVRSSKNTNGVP